MTHMFAYPSLIDPDGKSRNFDTIDGLSPLFVFHAAPLCRTATAALDLIFNTCLYQSNSRHSANSTKGSLTSF